MSRIPSAAVALAAVLAMTGAGASPLAAAEGLFLTWADCALGNVSHNANSVCMSNLGSNDLYVAFRMPFPVDSVIGIELVVDVQHATASLPDWWRFDPTRCRANQLVADFDFSLNPFCVDMWVDTPAGGLVDYTVGQPRGLPSQARIRVAGSLLPQNPRQLNDSDMYYGARLSLRNGNTAPPQTVCFGCSGSACLVLNSILVRRLPGAPGGDVTLVEPGAGNANFATWQGTTADCFQVPVRNRTWGQIKSLYR
jgi:hypothetical protein